MRGMKRANPHSKYFIISLLPDIQYDWVDCVFPDPDVPQALNVASCASEGFCEYPRLSGSSQL